MSDIERSIAKITPGNIKPTPELRQSLQEIDKCREFLERGGYIDYLNSINDCYLGSKGEVVGPCSEIDATVEEGMDGSDESGLLEIGSNSWGGMRLYLRYEQVDGQSNKTTKRGITIVINYDSINDYWQLLLYAARGESYSQTESISTGKYTQKSFLLNPNVRLSQDIDDLLLAFTAELLEARIL